MSHACAGGLKAEAESPVRTLRMGDILCVMKVTDARGLLLPRDSQESENPGTSLCALLLREVFLRQNLTS